MFSTIVDFFREQIFTLKEGSYPFWFMYRGYVSPLGSLLHARMLRKAKEQFPKGHRKMTTTTYSGVVVTIVSFAYDNYAYIVRKNMDINECLIVDCGDGEIIIDILKEFQWDPIAVLTTHKHWDHCYGNAALKVAYPNACFIGGKVDRPNVCTRLVSDGEELDLAGILIKVHEVFGHTLGHVVYEINQAATSTDPPIIFTGDTIFVAGIGKTFEGTNEQMVASLDQFKNKFCPATILFPGHEYARDGLGMASYLNPNDDTIYKAFQKVDAEYLQRIPSVPTTLADEFTWNPFLRTSQLTDGGSIKMRAEKLSELRKIKEAYMENRKTFDEEANEKRRKTLSSTVDSKNKTLNVEKEAESNLENNQENILENAFTHH